MDHGIFLKQVTIAICVTHFNYLMNLQGIPISQVSYAKGNPNYDELEASRWQAAQVSTLSVCNFDKVFDLAGPIRIDSISSRQSPALTMEIRVFFELDRTLGNGEIIGKLQTSWDELLNHGDEQFELSFPPVRGVNPSLTLKATVVHASDNQDGALLDSLVDCETVRETDAGHPLLVDEDYYARVEGREIISNLSKAAGFAHMIFTMSPDIDHADDKKSWQARHTRIRIVQQITIMMGCAVLPHLRNLVACIAHGLQDEQQKVRTMTALGLAALAEAATPYGIESFDEVLKPLWLGIRLHRGKGLAAFLKAIGFIIPLMDPEYASYYTKEVTVILICEFQTSDEERKKIVLKVVIPESKGQHRGEHGGHTGSHRCNRDTALLHEQHVPRLDLPLSFTLDVADGSGFNNANFMTPPDAQNGRCRMYLWNTANPYRNGDMEADIVIHELAHSLSTRLTGGPKNKLVEIQRRPEAWALIVSFLEHPDTNVQFFGAHTAQVKIMCDWDSFPEENAEHLRDLLLKLTSHSTLTGKGEVVCRKLFVTITSLALQFAPGSPSRWPDWIVSAVNSLSSSGMPPEQLLAFLTIVDEEVETADLLGPRCKCTSLFLTPLRW
ncbi:Fungalysin metallopeptidase-domain-containing protein [Suillus clintonianus]|uniref:Fungalysin metallopeptidase-domain-containing protein n=2 Tax=Suillus clintonianus TaxID=1904413 RepID=UPI001B87AADD|nr:Fungalysin metallopeptidase-domain-containing protein [Suillus clintonianus]KAG2118385.1 Fungalysin metallopeptidase-domain-containing protein [Suillus clintonianus]